METNWKIVVYVTFQFSVFILSLPKVQVFSYAASFNIEAFFRCKENIGIYLTVLFQSDLVTCDACL